MGKRKRSKKGKAPPVAHQNRNLWPERVLEELLAFLDYGVHKKMKPPEINDEAAQHLTDECGNGDYSSIQARSKFRWFWSEFGPNDAVSGDFDMIYEEGSKNLCWFKNGQREKIAYRTKAIMHKKHIEYLTSPRKTRSGSQALERSGASPNRFGSASASSAITFRGSKTAWTTKFHPRRRRNPDLSGPAVSIGSLSPFLANLTMIQDRNATSPLEHQGTPIKTEPTLTIFETPREPSSSCSENSQFRSAETSQSLSSTVLLTPSPLVMPASGETDVIITTELERSLESITKRKQQVEIELQQLEKKRTLDIDFLKTRCRSAETERAELKKMNTALIVKLGDFIREDQKLDAKDIAIYEARILTLKEKIDGFYQSERLAVSNAPNLPNDTILDITGSMKRITSRLRRSFEGQESYPCPRMLNASEASQLQSLFEKVLNVDLADSSILDIPKSLADRITRQTLLRSLSAAALAEWVFRGAGADILFDRYSGDSTRGLTSRYKRAMKYVASRGELTTSFVIEHSSNWGDKDPKFAKNIDFAIHRDIISEPLFKAFLYEKAADLAGRLQYALAPLWSRSEEFEDGFNDWSGTDMPALNELIEVFRTALKIHSQLVVTGRSYVCIWYAPGARYDPISMTTEPTISDQDSKAAVVEVTLLPGISELPRDYSGAGHGTFVGGGCMMQEAGECLIPAVVSISVAATAETRPEHGPQSQGCGG